MSPHLPQAPLRQSERGSVLVQFALLAAVIVTLLGVVQIGYMYYAKRDLQRVADIAAIEAVNAITYNDFDTCPLGKIAGSRSVSTQLRASIDLNTPDPQCGHWDGSKADAMRFDETRVGTFNAMRVQLQGEVLQLLPMVGSRVITATAIAAKDSEPLASFSIGSQLMRFRAANKTGNLPGAAVSMLG